MLKKVLIPAVIIMMSLTACGTKETVNKPNTISVTELSETASKPIYFPVSITTAEEAGERLVIKNFEVGPNVNPNDLTEATFERAGYRYTARDILRKELEDKEESKLASKQITIKTSTKDMNSVLKQAPVIMEYSDEEGYKGQLLLNTSNVFTESMGSRNYSYSVKETKTYTDLARNDSYYIPKSVTKNGKELALADVEWSVSGTTLAGSSLVPSSYSAIAYYEGTAYGSKSIGYNTTLTYIGEVTKVVDNGALVSVIYVGEKIYNLTWLWIGLPVLLLAVGIAVAVTLITCRKGEEERTSIREREYQKQRILESEKVEKIEKKEKGKRVYNTKEKDMEVNKLNE